MKKNEVVVEKKAEEMADRKKDSMQTEKTKKRKVSKFLLSLK